MLLDLLHPLTMASTAAPNMDVKVSLWWDADPECFLGSDTDESSSMLLYADHSMAYVMGICMLLNGSTYE